MIKFTRSLPHGRWFSSGTVASSTTKTGHHDIAESGVKTLKIISIKNLKSRVVSIFKIIRAVGKKCKMKHLFLFHYIHFYNVKFVRIHI